MVNSRLAAAKRAKLGGITSWILAKYLRGL
jgi:hypothetical protein